MCTAQTLRVSASTRRKDSSQTPCRQLSGRIKIAASARGWCDVLEHLLGSRPPLRSRAVRAFKAETRVAATADVKSAEQSC
jgi:hypothetical protein